MEIAPDRSGRSFSWRSLLRDWMPYLIHLGWHSGPIWLVPHVGPDEEPHTFWSCEGFGHSDFELTDWDIAQLLTTEAL